MPGKKRNVAYYLVTSIFTTVKKQKGIFMFVIIYRGYQMSVGLIFNLLNKLNKFSNEPV